MHTYRFSLLFFISLALFFSGCGKSEKKKEWRVAIDSSWYPLELGGREKQIEGFAIDLLQEVTTLEKIKIARVQENWDNLIPNLLKKQYEAILSSLQPYLFYEKQYDFSEPFLLMGPILVVPFGSNVKSLDSFSGKEVGIISGSSAELAIGKYPGIIVRYFDAIPSALNAILNSDVDAAVIDVLDATAYCQDLYQKKLKTVGSPLTSEGLRLITLHEGAPALVKAFNTTLKELKKSGKYAKIAKKWNLPEE